MAKRFASHSDEEITEKRIKSVPDNTQKANRQAANTFRVYLEEKKQATNFEEYDTPRLAEVLTHFYLDARKSNGELYKTSSLEHFRHSLNRYLNAPPINKNIDIIKHADFQDANMSFTTAMRELKAAGKGSTDHFPCITEEDMKLMYSSIHMNPNTPIGLYNKVQFEIRLYFCRRGGENIAQMTKDTFSVSVDQNGMRYVVKTKDEMTKNRREKEKESYMGLMPENKNSPFCPVASFEKYVSKLEPSLDRLWQRPKDSYCDTEPVWYSKRPSGKDTLSKFMSNMSRTCGLSQIYTNHSVRTTGVTILTKNNFSPAQIMALTGHKSVSSLAIYHRVSDEEKVQMGQTITNAVHGNPGSTPALCAPTTVKPLAITNVEEPNESDSPLRREETGIAQLDGFNLEDLFTDFDDGSNPVAKVSNYNTAIQERRQAPIFHGCKIGTVQIIFQQK